MTLFPTRDKRSARISSNRAVVVLLALAALLLVAGCSTSGVSQSATPAAPAAAIESDYIDSLDDYVEITEEDPAAEEAMLRQRRKMLQTLTPKKRKLT